MQDDSPFRIRQNRRRATGLAVACALAVAAMPLLVVAAALSGASVGMVFLSMPTLGFLTVFLFVRFGGWILPVIEGRVGRWELRLDPTGASYDDGEDLVRVGWGGYLYLATDAEIGAAERAGKVGALCLIRPGATVDRTIARSIARRLKAAPLRVSTVSGVTILPLGTPDADVETILDAARDLHASARARHLAACARDRVEDDAPVQAMPAPVRIVA